MAKRITTDVYATEPTKRQNPAHTEAIARVMRDCRLTIDREISRGDPDGQVWEVICDGPDVLWQRHGVAGVVCSALTVDLERYAIGRGWDRAADDERRRAMVMQRHSVLRRVDRVWDGRV